MAVSAQRGRGRVSYVARSRLAADSRRLVEASQLTVLSGRPTLQDIIIIRIPPLNSTRRISHRHGEIYIVRIIKTAKRLPHGGNVGAARKHNNVPKGCLVPAALPVMLLREVPCEFQHLVGHRMSEYSPEDHCYFTRLCIGTRWPTFQLEPSSYFCYWGILH